MVFIYICIASVVLLFFLYLYSKRPKPAEDPSQLQNYAGLLEQYVRFYQQLSPADKHKFVQRVSDFLKQVRIEGVGTTAEPLDRVLVAASAIIPIFAFDGWRYPNLSNVIIYPDTFKKEDFQFEGPRRNVLGMVGTGYMNGQMLLSRKALREGFAEDDGRNTGIHEFVHLLDKTDGSIDGLPENLLNKIYTAPWLKMMHSEMKQIASGRSDIDPYALTNEAEFFSVVSEYFFEKPAQLKKDHPRLYRLLETMFVPDLIHPS